MAVQGFGNAGAHFAMLAHEAGFKVVAVSDSGGAIYAEDGLDPEPLHKQKEEGKSLEDIYSSKSVSDCGNYEQLETGKLLTLDVDVLALAALEDAITADNVGDVAADAVLEIANGPVSHEADETLAERGIAVLPDVLSNAGGVTVSYYEWIQGRTGERWDADMVRDRLEARIVKVAKACFDRAEKDDTPLRHAAYAIAVERIAAAVESRGDSCYFQG